MSVLQQNFERMTAGIAEEEEFGAVEDVPPRQGITVYSGFSLKLHITFSLYGFNYVVVFRCIETAATKWRCTLRFFT